MFYNWLLHKCIQAAEENKNKGNQRKQWAMSTWIKEKFYVAISKSRKSRKIWLVNVFVLKCHKIKAHSSHAGHETQPHNEVY